MIQFLPVVYLYLVVLLSTCIWIYKQIECNKDETWQLVRDYIEKTPGGWYWLPGVVAFLWPFLTLIAFFSRK